MIKVRKNGSFDFSSVTDMEEAIFQSIGIASVCWSGEIFDSTRAENLGEALLEYVRSYVR